MAATQKDPVLVVVQLTGGNDYLNTVIPYNNGLYRDNRNAVSIGDNQIIHLDGTYNLPDETLDFQGELRMQAKLSQTVTGAKSFFLKFADPFFKKEGAGSVVPIRITGTRDDPKFALALFGKK